MDATVTARRAWDFRSPPNVPRDGPDVVEPPRVVKQGERIGLSPEYKSGL
jgi:hypothetical protein